MAEQKLLVKREGDFHYPIYFKNDFQDLAGAIREEGLENRKICIVTDSHIFRTLFSLQNFHLNTLSYKAGKEIFC